MVLLWALDLRMLVLYSGNKFSILHLITLSIYRVLTHLYMLPVAVADFCVTLQPSQPFFRPLDTGSPQEPASVIEQLVEALRYKMEGRGFDSPWGQ
jgi:hypothetical protein